MTTLLCMQGVSRHFVWRGDLASYLHLRPARVIKAVDGVDLAIGRAEHFGLIGESGCGKSTLGRLALRLREPTAGTVRFDGVDLGQLPPAELAALRPRMQIVFQDPFASLNPRRTVEQIVGLPLAVHGRGRADERRARVVEMLEWVGLDRQHLHRYPHEFSGGQRQRIGIARALVLRPDFLVCDEPASALDVSVQAQILELLERLRSELGLAMLFISHDIAVVARLSDRIGVMYLGRIVESGPARELVSSPLHPYSRMLLDAVPHLERRRGARTPMMGEPASSLAPPSGCAFRTRCPLAIARCSEIAPRLESVAGGRAVACHRAGEA